MNRFEKAAAFGAMMGKRAAEIGPTRSPTPQEQEYADNLRKSMSQPRGIASVRGGPVPNGTSSNQPNYPAQGFAGSAPINNPPAAGTFAGNSGPSMGASGPVSRNKAVDPGPPKMKYNNSSDAIVAARREDRRAGKLTEQRLAAMTPEQRQARTDQEIQAFRDEAGRQRDESVAYQKWLAANPGVFGHGLQPDHATMIALATAGTTAMGVGANGVIGGGTNLGGAGVDAWNLGKSLLPQTGRTWGQYAGGVGKNLLSYEPTGVSKALATGFAEGGARNMIVPAAVAYGRSKFNSMVRNGPGEAPYNAATDPYTSYAAGKSQATPGTSFAGEPEPIPGTRTVGEPQAAPGTNTVGKPQARPMAGTIPNVPRG